MLAGRNPLLRCVLLAALVVLSACAAGNASGSQSLQSQPQPAATPKRLDWSEVPALLRSGRVEAVFQLHDLTVTLTTREGEEFVTREPSLDAIFAAIRDYAPNAPAIVLATE